MKKSFTLVELLVVIAIISTLSAIAFASYRRGGKTFALLRSAHFLASEIRKAQEMAMSAQKIGNQYPPGYGIYLRKSPQKIILFADKNGNNLYESSEKIEDFHLESKIEISSLSPSPLTIVFKPPHPTTIINANENNLEAKIVLTNGSQTKTIKANKAGLIAVSSLPPSPPPPTCSDSDGNNPYIKGTCRDRNGSHTDYCFGIKAVKEFYCSGGYCRSTTFFCGLWEKCNDGKCVFSFGF